MTFLARRAGICYTVIVSYPGVISLPTKHPVRSITLMAVLRPFFVLALVSIGFSLHPKFLSLFWTANNLPNIFEQAATTIILAVGMTFVILTGGIDLSVGSVLALCGITLGLTVKTGPPIILCLIMAFPLGVAGWVILARMLGTENLVKRLASGIFAMVGMVAGALIIYHTTRGGIQLEGAIVAALVVGCSLGLLNGLGVTLGRVPPFVMTLGVMTAARGLTVFVTDGKSVSDLPQRLGPIGVGLPLILITFTVVALGALLLSRLRAGRYILAIGGNREASRLSGVNIRFYTILPYILSGLAAAIAAIVLTARFQLADTNAGSGAELFAIAAVVIGGTSLSGGQGSIIGSMVGALTMAVLKAGLVLVGVQDTLQGVVIGAVIVLTVMLDNFKKNGRA